jgi:hypothetical protein
MNLQITSTALDPSEWVPSEVGPITNHQTDLPRIAKDKRATAAIAAKVVQIPTVHDIYNKDARSLGFLRNESVHLIVTSPPYWTLKEYRETPAHSSMGWCAMLGPITRNEIRSDGAAADAPLLC